MVKMRIRRQRTPVFVSIALVALLAGCRSSDDGSENKAAPQSEPAMNLSAKVPLPEPSMDRAALLQAIAEARSAAAAGQDDAQAQRQLDGKQFELRIRFGCGGPAARAGEGDLGWVYDEAKGALRIWATPTISAEDPVATAAHLPSVEAVEGFWVPRPWLLQPACPPPPKPAAEQADEAESTNMAEAEREQAPEVSGPRVGIAQFFTTEDARTRRRDDRPYQSVTSVNPAPDSSNGYDLVISGRLRAIGDGRVIRCSVESADRAPDCIVSVRTDRVRVERPGTGETIAQWSSS